MHSCTPTQYILWLLVTKVWLWYAPVLGKLDLIQTWDFYKYNFFHALLSNSTPPKSLSYVYNFVCFTNRNETLPMFMKLWSHCIVEWSSSSELIIKVASGSRFQGNGAQCFAIFWQLALIRKSPSSADAIIFFAIGFSFCRNQLVDSPIPLDSVAISMCMLSSDYY